MPTSRFNLVLIVILVCLLGASTALRVDASAAANLLAIRILKEVYSLPPLQPRELTEASPRPKRQDVAFYAERAASAGLCRLSGNLFLMAGEPERALETLRPCSDHPLAQFFRAFAHASLGREDEARSTLSQVPGISVYLFEGGMQEHEQGNLQSAVWLLAEALEQDRNRGQISSDDRTYLYRYLTWDYNQLGERQVAIAWAQRWVESDLMHFESSTALAGLYIWSGDYEKAFQVLQRVEPLGGRNAVHFAGQMGQIYQSRGEWDLAIEEYRESWARGKDVESLRPYAAWYLGVALYYQGEMDEARFYLEVVRRTGHPLQADATAILEQMGVETVP